MKHAIKLLLLILATLLTACSQMRTNGSHARKLINMEREKNETDSIREQEHKKAWEEANEYRKTITDSVFLETRVPMSDQAIDYLTPTGWNKEYAHNQVVYLGALERVKKHLSVKNNQFILPLKSGAEINIAEDLFQYIAGFVINKWNEWIRKGIVVIEKTDEGYYDIVPQQIKQTSSTHRSE